MPLGTTEPWPDQLRIGERSPEQLLGRVFLKEYNLKQRRILKLLKISNPLPRTGTLANSEDLNTKPHNAAFHQGLYCLLRYKHSSGTEAHLNLEIPI